LRRPSALLLIVAASTLSCVCSRGGSNGGSNGDFTPSQIATDFKLNVPQANLDLAELTEAPHPFGSPRQREVLAFLEESMKAKGLATVREEFSALTPNPAALNAAGPVQETLTKSGANLYAFTGVVPEAPCVVLLASHYDTKIVEGTSYLGANDSGSSSVVLMQQLAHVKANAEAAKKELVCEIAGVWFDGEEAVLTNWTDGERIHPAKIVDNTYGSRHAARRLTACTYEGKTAKCLPADLGGKPLVAIILMDMIGSPDLRITRDAYSSQLLVDMTVAAAKSLGMADRYGSYPQAIEDDHVAFRQAGVAGIDLIDFNDVSRWHQAGDDPAFVSTASMDMAGRLALAVALGAGKEPLPMVEKP
jgi:hypothetical protein